MSLNIGMMLTENRKIAKAYMNMYEKQYVCEGIGGIIKRIFRSRTKDEPFGNPKTPKPDGNGAERRQAAVPKTQSIEFEKDDSSNEQQIQSPKNQNNTQQKPFSKFELSLSNPEFSRLSSSMSSRITSTLGNYAKNGFEIYRQMTQDGIVSACAIKRNSSGMNDVGVYAIAPLSNGGDVELIKSILSNFSSAGILWVNASNGASADAVNYMNEKMRNFKTENGKSIFFRRYGSTSDLSMDEKGRIAKLTS